jgi:hypothetical protein
VGRPLVNLADMTIVDTLNFVEGTEISIQTSPNPADPDVLDIEISSTFVDDDSGSGGGGIVAVDLLTNPTVPDLIFAGGDVIVVTYS